MPPHKDLIESGEIIPVAPLRDRFKKLLEAGEISACEVAWRMRDAGHEGFVRKPSGSTKRRSPRRFEHPDTSRVKRMLGVMSVAQGKRRKDGTRYGPVTAKYIRYEYALTLLEILGLDPIDVGI